MAKLNVYIEEHLCKKIEIEVPDSLDVDKRMEIAETKIISEYKKGNIVLSADDYNGIKLTMVEDEKTGQSTEWKEF